MSKLSKFNIKKFLLEKKIRKILFIIIVAIFLLLMGLYYIIGIIYNSGNFSITLDGNLYFDTSEEAIVDKQIQNALAIGGYRTARLMAVPGGWDYYEVVFDKNNIAISQKISTQFDGP